MAIVGFNFMKFDVERKESFKGKLNISNNVSIKDIEETDLFLGSNKQKGLKFNFIFTSDYAPSAGHIKINGHVLYMEDAKRISEIQAEWKKSKKLPKEVTGEVLNNVLMKCNIKALILATDLNLPPPIPLPKVDMKDAAK